MNVREKFLYGFAFFILFFTGIWLVGASLFGQSDQNQDENGPPQTLVARVRDARSILKTIQSQQKSAPPSFSQGLESIAENYLPAAPVSGGLSAGAKQAEKEIAENLFPAYYSESLSQMQNGFIRAGWMKEEERVAFNTEQGIFAFLKRSVEMMVSRGVYRSDKEAERARVAVDLFPQMWAIERQQYKQKNAFFYKFFTPNKIFSAPLGKSAEFEARKEDIMAGFFSALVPESTHAQSQFIDSFVTFPDCWKSKSEQRLKKGDNLFALCCNCGLCIIPPYREEFVYDCGKPEGGDCGQSACNIPLGCLNLICAPANANNAIFDGPPGYKVPATAGYGGGFNINWSFTCGCDR